MTTLAYTAVAEDGRGAPAEIVVNRDALPGLAKLVDTVHAADRREAAAERREKWEARVLELHGGVFPAEDTDWDDD